MLRVTPVQGGGTALLHDDAIEESERHDNEDERHRTAGIPLDLCRLLIMVVSKSRSL